MSGEVWKIAEIRLKQLEKSFEVSKNRHPVLRQFSTELDTEKITVILGRSGCGKTTLLRILAGLESLDGGEILFEKQEKLGVVFQEPRLMPWLTVNANIAFAVKNDPSLPAAPDEKLLELLGLKAFQHSFPAQLSGGMAQRTALGRTLFQNPDLILMDEPFSALDYFTRRSLQQMLLNLFQQQKKSVIFVTHDVEEALLLGQRILVMQEGRIKIDQRIDMEYPRQQASLSFQQLRLQILSAIEN